MRRSRSLPILATTIALAAALAGCASEPETPDVTATSDPSSSAAPAIDVCATETGGAADLVTVTGDFGTPPEVAFEAGLTTENTVRATVAEGDGPVLEAGLLADVGYALYDGTTGESIETYGYDDAETVRFAADATQTLPGMAEAIGCVTQGSRIVSVIPPAQGAELLSQAGLGIDAESTLVAVVDIENVIFDRATGVDQEPVEGMPTVTLADDGRPTVEIPDTDPPADLEVATLKLGDGPVVAEGATVRVQYQGTSWDTGEIFDESWAGNGPIEFGLGQVIEGWSQALVGQTVGSQVLAVIPPDLAYGTDPDAHDLGGQTLVFVVDILATS